jgi:hypothetical protein
MSRFLVKLITPALLTLTLNSPAYAANLARQVQADSANQLELLVLIKTKTGRNDMQPAPFARDIDNNVVFNRSSGSLMYNNCFVENITLNYGSVSGEIYEQVPAERDQHYLAVRTVYENLGVTGINKIANDYAENLLNSLSSSVKLRKDCRDNQPATMSYSGLNSTELAILPRYLLEPVLATRGFNGLADYEVLDTISLAQLKQIASANAAAADSLANSIAERENAYQRLASAKDRSAVGSLIVSYKTSGDKVQALCAIDVEGEDAMAVLGYRSMMEAILPEPQRQFYKNQELTLGYQNNQWLSKSYKTINEVFLEITNGQSPCNVYIDFPENIEKLKKALANREIKTVFGELLASTDMHDQYAKTQGYLDKAEFYFSYEVSADKEQLGTLRSYAVNNSETYSALVAEASAAGYAEELDIATIIAYLADRAEAQNSAIAVTTVRDNRLQQQQLQAQADAERRQREQQEFLRNYPYQAIISCSFQNQHANLLVCLKGGEYAAETTLEVQNGANYALYNVYNIDSAGRETRDGLILDLRDTFSLKMQNSSADLILSIVIKERASGAVMYQKSAGQYGVLYVEN